VSIRERFFGYLHHVGRRFAYWAEQRQYNGNDCVTSEKSSGHNIPSRYNLVGDCKFGMDHANLTRLFNDSPTTVYSKKFRYAEVGMFVASVFAAQTGRETSDFSIVYEPVMSEPNKYGDCERIYTSGRLLFDEPTHQAFNEWLKEYEKRLPTNYDYLQMLPVITDGEKVTGYFVDHNCEFEPRRRGQMHEEKDLFEPDDELFDEWLWMLNNTSGMVRIHGDKWVFEEASDAMMYQLQLR